MLAAAAPAGHFGREIERRRPAGSLGMPTRTLFLHPETAAHWRNTGSAADGFGSDWVRGEIS
ncbi:hypothetical protein HMPREF0281_01311 [Corynebacterium ammoniagenes DSM 20306]|uniref:Uncharacterized protein n=1 Tax=Corynebacterium ammoniagenes DSM 20306 TaxID=649754 RepID=A0ABP2IFW2_CORAM|nr:hypothetical protein HMPREF0281_01311 [Corynebacterium ammoniagenes DSM 20306]